MQKFRFSFTGRQTGAVGICYKTAFADMIQLKADEDKRFNITAHGIGLCQ